MLTLYRQIQKHDSDTHGQNWKFNNKFLPPGPFVFLTLGNLMFAD